MKQNEIVSRIVRDYFANNAQACADYLGMNRQYVHAMMRGVKPISPTRALQLEAACGRHYKAEEMNPKAAELRTIVANCG